MLHNEIKTATSLGKALRRFIGLDDAQAGVERLGETLSPGFDIFGGFVPDLDFLLDRKHIAGQFTSAAAVGNQSYVLLGNTSNDLLLIVYSMRCDQTALLGVLNNLAAAFTGAAATASSAFCTDTRWRLGTGHIVHQAVTLQGNAAAPGGLNFASRGPGVLFEIPVVIGPGESFMITGQAVNTTINPEIHWIERKLLPGERGRFGVGA